MTRRIVAVGVLCLFLGFAAGLLAGGVMPRAAAEPQGLTDWQKIQAVQQCEMAASGAANGSGPYPSWQNEVLRGCLTRLKELGVSVTIPPPRSQAISTPAGRPSQGVPSQGVPVQGLPVQGVPVLGRPMP